jgi:hypothetical protein
MWAGAYQKRARLGRRVFSRPWIRAGVEPNWSGRKFPGKSVARRRTNFFWYPFCRINAAFHLAGTPHLCGSEELCRAPSFAKPVVAGTDFACFSIRFVAVRRLDVILQATFVFRNNRVAPAWDAILHDLNLNRQ